MCANVTYRCRGRACSRIKPRFYVKGEDETELDEASFLLMSGQGESFKETLLKKLQHAL